MAIIITYPIGSSSQVTLSLPGSNWGEPSGFLSCDDVVRSLDGTLNSYRSFRKRHKNLKWDYLTPDQKVGLENLYAFGGPFNFADDTDLDNQFVAFMPVAPNLQQVVYGCWEGDVEVQEV